MTISTDPDKGNWSVDAAEEEYEFLVGQLIDRATLRRAAELAGDWDVEIPQVLIANGWVDPTDYAEALARACHVELVEPRENVTLTPSQERSNISEALAANKLRHLLDGSWHTVLAHPSEGLGQLRQRLAEFSSTGERVVFSTRHAFRRAVAAYYAPQVTDHAIHGLSRRFAGECADKTISPRQSALLITLACVIGIAAVFFPLPTLRSLTAILAVFFFLVVGLRILALSAKTRGQLKPAAHSTFRPHDTNLPVYTILIPLFREANILEDLARALKRIDYPPAKLDIKLIFESIDTETQEAAELVDFPGNTEFIVVPDTQPRTKPKALNYALAFARGDYVVVYDAEDRPEPDQLKKALDAFGQGPDNLACLQAELNFYNGSRNWLTKQFTIEYSVLFRALLPTLKKLGLPVPLGGTSNHFRLSALRWLGAWDAFNVTEDADLGIRLARRGYVCHMLDSTTLEEATSGIGAWIKQRTRWLKGWMQTYLVHMRHPAKLWRDLGGRGFIGFQLVIGGMIFSALALLPVYAMAATEAVLGIWLNLPGSLLGISFWVLALFNLCVGYAVSMVLGLISLRPGSRRYIAAHVLFMPIYWLLISVAAYRALLQLMSDPHYWEKTEHGVG